MVARRKCGDLRAVGQIARDGVDALAFERLTGGGVREPRCRKHPSLLSGGIRRTPNARCHFQAHLFASADDDDVAR